MSEQENLQIIKDFYAQFLSGDPEGALLRFLAPDVIWENPLPAPIPFGGIFHGYENVRRYFRMILEYIDIKEFPVAEHIAQGDTVVVLGSEASRVKSIGRSYQMDWVHVLRVTNGRIRRVREYNDTAAMVVAFAGR